ncbi:MAG: single-stranded-DNA-specific exonuclease RecJ [Candidatus Saccharimonadales bacterium]
MEISPILEEILSKRGIKTGSQRDSFLNPQYEDLHDPFLLKDMDKAVEAISSSIKRGDNIVVYGDYDIDGLSATALLLDGITAMGGKISAYIPDRFEEGYGINTKALKKLKKQAADLVITVDCGSTSHESLTWAKENNLDVIVTDHHLTKDTLPPAVAVINPKRTDDEYPFKDLAGVGVAFKLVQGLQSKGLLPRGREKWLLDLVALGSVCDVVSLTGENRVLVKYGLTVFAKTSRIGLKALMAVAGVNREDIDTYHFGFVLGPRLNAAGRLSHAKLALDLFTATDKNQAWQIADKLDKLNSERRSQQDQITIMAEDQALEHHQDNVLVLSHSDWNHGIVGIVAAKITEEFNKPTIILQEMGDESKGSARSKGSFNIVEGMSAADDLLIKYGGHKVAAGCTLKTADINKFRQKINKYFKDNNHTNKTQEPDFDVELQDISMLTHDLVKELEMLRPFGMGNSTPVFLHNKAHITNKSLVGADSKHLKFRLSDGDSHLSAIAFNFGKIADDIGDVAKVFFELDENYFNGITSLQAKVKAVR